MIRRIVPLLDPVSPRPGVFREALEWASRLHLPIRAMSLRFAANAQGENEDRLLGKTFAETFAENCARLAISWQEMHQAGRASASVRNFLRPEDLLLIGQQLDSAQKQFLFRCAGGRNGPAVGVCADSFSAISRILYVHQESQSAGVAIGSVVDLCRDLAVPLVVLSLAGSEREAWQQQQFAEQTVAAHRYPADFDSLVGVDLRSAVIRVAGWRRCTHVVLERRNESFWWRWLGGDPVERLLGWSDPLTFLTLPDVEASARLIPVAATR